MKPANPDRAVWTQAEYEWVIGEWRRRQLRALGPLVLVLAAAAVLAWAKTDAPRTDPLPSTNPLPPLVIAGVAGLLGWNAYRQWRCPACDRPPARHHRGKSWPRECVHCRAPLRR
jgi:hypothetical protein